MLKKTMTKTYKARLGWRSAGFNVAAVSVFLSLSMVAMLLIGLLNNSFDSKGNSLPFNSGASLAVVVGLFVLWVGILVTVAQLMKNDPRTVRLSDTQLEVNGRQGYKLEIPLTTLMRVDKTQVPVTYWKYKASFRGLKVYYKLNPNEAETSYILSERDTTDFEDLIARLRALSPKPVPSQ